MRHTKIISPEHHLTELLHGCIQEIHNTKIQQSSIFLKKKYDEWENINFNPYNNQGVGSKFRIIITMACWQLAMISHYFQSPYHVIHEAAYTRNSPIAQLVLWKHQGCHHLAWKNIFFSLFFLIYFVFYISCSHVHYQSQGISKLPHKNTKSLLTYLL